jgi:predicted dehydrogenase
MLRAAVIGVGAFGKNHVRVYRDLEGVELVGVADARRERAEEIAGAFGTKAFSEAQELLGKVDAVSVATPTVTHAEVAEPFLRAGVHALVEKPLAPSLEEADRLVRAAREGGAVLAVGHLERFNPAVEHLLSTVRAPRFVEVHRLSGFPERSLDVDVLLDLMTHDLDILLAMVQRPVAEVRAAGVAALTDKVDIANARLEFEGGCVANLTASRISRERMRKLRVFEPQRYMSVDYDAQEVESFRLALRPGARPEVVREAPSIERGEPLRRELEHFVRCAQGKDSPRISGAWARDVIALILRIREEIEGRLGRFTK